MKIGDWFSSAIESAIWSMLSGWAALVPFEMWFIIGGGLAALMFTKYGMGGLVLLGSVASYVAGVMRGREMQKKREETRLFGRKAKPKRDPPVGENRSRRKRLFPWLQRKNKT